jgi:hypothetical protein
MKSLSAYKAGAYGPKIMSKMVQTPLAYSMWLAIMTTN